MPRHMRSITPCPTVLSPGRFLITLRDAARPNSELLVAPLANASDVRVSRQRTRPAFVREKSFRLRPLHPRMGRLHCILPPLLLVDLHRGGGTRPSCEPPHPQVLIAHRADVQLEGVGVSQKHLLLHERADALTRVVLHPLPTGGAIPEARAAGAGKAIDFEEAVHDVGGGESWVVPCGVTVSALPAWCK